MSCLDPRLKVYLILYHNFIMGETKAQRGKGGSPVHVARKGQSWRQKKVPDFSLLQVASSMSKIFA